MGMAGSYRREEGDAQLRVSLLPSSISIKQPLLAPWRWSKDLSPGLSGQWSSTILGTLWSSINVRTGYSSQLGLDLRPASFSPPALGTTQRCIISFRPPSCPWMSKNKNLSRKSKYVQNRGIQCWYGEYYMAPWVPWSGHDSGSSWLSTDMAGETMTHPSGCQSPLDCSVKMRGALDT